MLNLSQRLILGCVLIAALGVSLVAVTHRALAAAGQLHIAIALLISLILIEVAMAVLVLQPIKMLADDAKKIAGGNLEHRVEWGGHDSFGVIAAELNRIAVRLRDLRDTEAGRRQMEYQLSDAVLLAERMGAKLADAEWPRDGELTVTASIGVAAFPEAGTQMQMLLKAADAALFRAKQAGRITVYPRLDTLPRFAG